MPNLTPEKQFAVLAKIWGRDRDGFVFLPWIKGSCTTADERKENYHEGRAFAWPRESDAILDHLRTHTEDDVYFTPATFNGKRRIERNVDAERALWADLDPVNPEELGALRPTIAWETSPGRYQGVWLLNTPKTGASWASRENHRLTLYLGADPSGWDGPQLLRVPGRPNFKPREGGPVPGRLMWSNGPRYVWSDFEDLPEVGIVGQESLLDEDLLESLDRHEVWARVRLKVSASTREAMGLRTAPAGTDRSSKLWELERELADAGCSLAEIVLLIRHSVWNKYRGRADELQRLKTEAGKAIAARPDTAVGVLEEEVPKPSSAIWLNDLGSQPIPRPRWLVNQVWTRGGCGFITGIPKSYKSWMAMDLAVSVATGTPFLDQPDYATRPAPVLYLQEEDDLRLVMERLAIITEAKAPASFWHGQVTMEGSNHPGTSRRPQRPVWLPPADRIPMAVHVQTGFISSDEGWQSWLAEMVAEHRFALVVIDTMGTTAGDIDTDRAAEVMNRMLKPLKTIAQTHDCAVAIVHHNKKGESSRAGQDMLGSTALHAWVDCGLYVRSKDKNGTLTFEREAKMAMDFTIKINIPVMYRNIHTGERVLWSPELQPERVDEVQEESTSRKPVKSMALIRFKSSTPSSGWAKAERIRDVLSPEEIKQLLDRDQIEYDETTDRYHLLV